MDVTTADTVEWNLGISTTIAPTDVTKWSWTPSTETCILIYMGLVIGIIVLSLASTFSFFSMCMTASINLHNTMFNNISRATMWFFNNNPSGNSTFQFFYRGICWLLADASVYDHLCHCPICKV
jgi:hypothetical protein